MHTAPQAEVRQVQGQEKPKVTVETVPIFMETIKLQIQGAGRTPSSVNPGKATFR